MCAAILPRLFKLNNKIQCDQAINNIEHEMFADGKVLHEPGTPKCIAVTFNAQVVSTKDIPSQFKSFSDKIQKNEQIYNGEDCQTTLKQINLAVDFMNNCTKHEPFTDVDLIKRETAVIAATSNKSLFEILVSIQYATFASKKITIILDERRAYLKELLLSTFKAEAIDVDYSIAESSSFCTQIIFDSADFQSAFHVLATAFNETTSPWKIRSCWIQDTLKQKFLNCFESQLTSARELNKEQKIKVENLLTESKQFDATVFQSKDKNATFLVGLTKKHIDSDLCVVVNFFRTPKEVVSLVQATDRTNSISLWSESISLVYDVADKLDVENVWINSNGLLHPEVPFTFGVGAEKKIYGSKLGIAQMFDTQVKPLVGSNQPTYSSALTVPGKYNFQTTSRSKQTPFIVEDSTNRMMDAELKHLIDVTQANILKTICFPFGQIFGN